MKKLLFLILILGAVQQMNAQNYVFPLLSGDTLTNADSTSYVFDTRQTNADVKCLIQTVLDRKSGTGTIYLNVYTTNFAKDNWAHIATDTVGTSKTNVLTKLDNNATFGRYIKVTVKQTGTAVTVPRLAYLLRLN